MSFSLHNDPIIIPILQQRKQGLREVKSFAQDCITSKWLKWDLNLFLSASRIFTVYVLILRWSTGGTGLAVGSSGIGVSPHGGYFP